MSQKKPSIFRTNVKHRWKLLLSGFSIFLLVGFLILWLSQQYNLQSEVLQKELNSRFSESFMQVNEKEMHRLLSEKLGKDSVILDSLKMNFHPPRMNRRRFFRNRGVTGSLLRATDTLSIGLDSSKEKILIRAALPDRFHQDSSKYRTYSAFSIRQRDGLRFFALQDTFMMDIKVLYSVFESSMDSAGIDVPVFVRQVPDSSSFPQSVQDTFFTNWYPAGSLLTDYYVGVATDVHWYLIKKIMPLILFSILLTVLIILALWMMYRSILQTEKLNQIKSQLVSNMSHELKTPVATVAVAIEALQHFHALQDPQKTRDYLSIAKSELDRLSILVEKVMHFSVLDQGKVQIDRRDVDLNLLLLEAERCMSIQVQEKSGKLDIVLHPDPVIVEGDATHLLHVLINLLDNALKYSDQTPWIQIVLQQYESKAILSVSDNGPGIDAAYRNKIFDRFFRVPTGDQHNIKGHGLGLSYVREIILLHAGQIRVESGTNSGSTFIIELPLSHHDSQ